MALFWLMSGALKHFNVAFINKFPYALRIFKIKDKKIESLIFWGYKDLRRTVRIQVFSI